MSAASAALPLAHGFRMEKNAPVPSVVVEMAEEMEGGWEGV